VRLSKNYRPALAKPCPDCASFLSALNIREVYFTSNNGWSSNGNII
jgi:hypothetical protein